MRNFVRFAPLMLIGLIASSVVYADSSSREREIAEIRYKLYRHVEYPLRIRRLDSDIKLAKAEIESLKRAVKEYGHFNTRYSKPFFQSEERAKLDLLRAEVTLKDLQYERSLLLKYRETEKRLRALLLQGP